IFIISQCITKLARFNQFQFATEFYHLATQSKQIDEAILNSFIDVAGKNMHFSEAKAAFDEAKHLRLANTVTFNSFINVAGKNGHFSEAKTAFDEAKRLRLTDTVTFTSFIDAAGRNGDALTAQKTFQEAQLAGK